MKTQSGTASRSSVVKQQPIFSVLIILVMCVLCGFIFWSVGNAQGAASVKTIVAKGYNIQGSHKIRTNKRADGVIEYPYGFDAPTYLTFEPDDKTLGYKKPSKDKDKGRWGLGTLGNKDKEPVAHGRYEATDDPNIYVLYDAQQKKFAILHTAYMNSNHQDGSVWLLQEDGRVFEYVPESKAISKNLLP